MWFLLIPSALLGPSSWSPVATALERLGHRADVVRESEVAEPGAILVPHSNAGLGAADLAVRVEASAIVYVDAALPTDAHDGTCARAPAEFREFLAGLADGDGVLPPWTQWWSDDDLEGLFPDAATQAVVEAEQQRLPLRWYDSRVPVPDGWAERPSAYLAFGDAYAEQTAFARGQGWPVVTMSGLHLHQLHDPDGVAATIADLAGRLVPQVGA